MRERWGKPISLSAFLTCALLLTSSLLADCPYLQCFTSLSTLEGFADSPSLISMIGSGFESSLEANYSCVFTSLDSSRMAIHMRAIYVSTSQLNCSWKPWPFPAGASSVKLLRGTEQVPTNGAGPYFFNFITSWNSFLPDGGIAFGGTETSVAVSLFVGNQCANNCDGQVASATRVFEIIVHARNSLPSFRVSDFFGTEMFSCLDLQVQYLQATNVSQIRRSDLKLRFQALTIISLPPCRTSILQETCISKYLQDNTAFVL